MALPKRWKQRRKQRNNGPKLTEKLPQPYLLNHADLHAQMLPCKTWPTCTNIRAFLNRTLIGTPKADGRSNSQPARYSRCPCGRYVSQLTSHKTMSTVSPLLWHTSNECYPYFENGQSFSFLCRLPTQYMPTVLPLIPTSVISCR